MFSSLLELHLLIPNTYVKICKICYGLHYWFLMSVWHVSLIIINIQLLIRLVFYWVSLHPQAQHLSPPYKSRPIVTKLKLCKIYAQRKKCQKLSCPYMHRDFPCTKAHLGRKCEARRCFFSHEPLNPKMKQVLKKHLKSLDYNLHQKIPGLSVDAAFLLMEVQLLFRQKKPVPEHMIKSLLPYHCKGFKGEWPTLLCSCI